MYLKNKMHTVMLEIVFNSSRGAQFIGGRLPGDYILCSSALILVGPECGTVTHNWCLEFEGAF